MSKLVSYFGSYTYMSGNPGISVYDLEMDPPTFTLKDEVRCSNASYMIISHSGKVLYSITDEGLASFDILEDGNLSFKNTVSIKGMRGCALAVDIHDRFIFVGGFHDGKLTALRLNEDGSLGEITANIFHKGYSTDVRKQKIPHITCVWVSPSGKYVFAVDSGIDHIKVYQLNESNGSLKQVDILRCDLESSPRRMGFTLDGRFMYVVSGGRNTVDVYKYSEDENGPIMELIQKASTCPSASDATSSTCALCSTEDEEYVFAANEGNNSVCIFKRDAETGFLQKLNVCPISGDYPKDIKCTPDGSHLISVNHQSNTATIFKVDKEKGILIMHGKPVKVIEPNVCLIHEVK